MESEIHFQKTEEELNNHTDNLVKELMNKLNFSNEFEKRSIPMESLLDLANRNNKSYIRTNNLVFKNF